MPLLYAKELKTQATSSRVFNERQGLSMKKYYKETNISFFPYYVNIKTGKRKLFLEEGEIEVEKPALYNREELQIATATIT